MGIVLDKLGFEREIKNVSIKGGHTTITWEKLNGAFWQKQSQVMKLAFKDSFGLFKDVFLYLLLGAGIGAFIYGFVPTDLLGRFAGKDNLWQCLWLLSSAYHYIRTDHDPHCQRTDCEGCRTRVTIALILGGRGQVSEVSLLRPSSRKRWSLRLSCVFFLVQL